MNSVSLEARFSPVGELLFPSQQSTVFCSTVTDAQFQTPVADNPGHQGCSGQGVAGGAVPPGPQCPLHCCRAQARGTGSHCDIDAAWRVVAKLALCSFVPHEHLLCPSQLPGPVRWAWARPSQVCSAGGQISPNPKSQDSLRGCFFWEHKSGGHQFISQQLSHVSAPAR